jgi:hypothetical protein
MNSITHSRTLLLLALAGCGPNISSAQFADGIPSPAAAEVKVFSTKMPVCEFDEIGLIRGERDNAFSSLQGVMDAMREKARDMGGDAIIGVGVVRKPDGSTVVDAAEASGTLSGVVIRFKDRGCTQ